jgi:hypothetical protein
MSEEKIFKAMLVVKNPGGIHWEGLGARSFRSLPQLGELLDVSIGKDCYLYKIVAIRHPEEPDQYPVDIYAVQLGPHLDVMEKLFNDS